MHKRLLLTDLSDDFELRKRTKRIIIFFLLTPFWSGFLMIIAVRFLAKSDRNIVETVFELGEKDTMKPSCKISLAERIN